MKSFLTIVFLSIAIQVFSQHGKPLENTANKVQRVVKKVSSKADELNKLDTIPSAKPDSLKIPTPGIPDSLKGGITNPLDTLKNPLDRIKNNGPALGNQGVRGADKIQSVQEKVSDVSSSAQSKAVDVQNNLSEKTNEIANKGEQKLNTLTGKENNLDLKKTSNRLDTDLPNISVTDQKQLPNKDLNLPETKIDTSLPGINKDKSSSVPGLPEMPKTKLPDEVNEVTDKVKDIKEQSKEIAEATEKAKEVSDQTKDLEKLQQQEGVKDVADKTSELGELKGQTDKYKDQAKTVKEEGIKNVDTKKLEQQATKLDEVKEVSSQSEKLKQLQANEAQLEMLQKYRDKKFVQEELKKKSANVVNDQLKMAAPLNEKKDELAKVKRRSSDVKNYTDSVRLKRENAMKGKPFKDRIVPGVTIQTLSGVNELLFDIGPQVGYRFTGRLTTGAGVVSRIGVGKANPNWVSNEHVFGYRIYSDFTLGRGIFLHGEYEALKFRVVDLRDNQSNNEKAKNFNIGLGKKYKISRNVQGRLIAMYRVDFNGDIRGQSKFAIRVGFDYIFKKKRKLIL